MSVAIPTAMPVAPFNNRFGNLAGNTVGSRSVPSKLLSQSTVPWPSSSKRLFAYGERRHSVYLIAAKDFGSSMEPQLP